MDIGTLFYARYSFTNTQMELFWPMKILIGHGMYVDFFNIDSIKTWISFQGLFYRCTSRANTPCLSELWKTTFILCLLGIVFLLVGGILICWDLFQISDRRFVIPLLIFVACVLLTAGVFDYGSWARLNSHSSRTMMCRHCFRLFSFTHLGFCCWTLFSIWSICSQWSCYQWTKICLNFN